MIADEIPNHVWKGHIYADVAKEWLRICPIDHECHPAVFDEMIAKMCNDPKVKKKLLADPQRYRHTWKTRVNNVGSNPFTFKKKVFEVVVIKPGELWRTCSISEAMDRSTPLSSVQKLNKAKINHEVRRMRALIGLDYTDDQMSVSKEKYDRLLSIENMLNRYISL